MPTCSTAIHINIFICYLSANTPVRENVRFVYHDSLVSVLTTNATCKYFFRVRLMSTFKSPYRETGEIKCIIMDWRNSSDLCTKGMMPKYKSIKDSLPWTFGESLACFQQEEFCVLGIQNHLII